MDVTVRSRLSSAVLFAAGLSLVAAGLVSFLAPSVAGEGASVVSPPEPLPSPSRLVFPPVVATSPSPSPSGPIEAANATRIVIPGLKIDLPIVEGPTGYPYCNVAMYHPALHQPGEDGATFIYAHARKGMFLPLLEESQRSNGKKMKGMLINVYTADDRVHVYEIKEVRRHQLTLDRPVAAKTDQLWLQTSEGPKGTKPKLHLMAAPVTVLTADPAEAHPKAKPVKCG